MQTRDFVLVLLTIIPMCFGNTAVLILARGGSKGIPLKNLQRVGGSTLLCRTIKTAKGTGLNDITVSTDHPLIALEALNHGVHPFLRSRVTATDWAPSIWGAAEFISKRPDVTILVLLQATSPFVRPEQIQKALKNINHPKSYDCVFSGLRSYKLRWKQKIDVYSPINFDVKVRPRRQDWDGELIETGAFYISRRHLIETGYFQNHNCTIVTVSEAESLEVDTFRDLQVANALLNSNLIV